MPLQIRRGPTADRLAITPLVGELVYDTTTGAVFVGNGSTAGGVPVTSFSVADSKNATAELFLGLSFTDNTQHSGITFQYTAGRLQATVAQNLSNYIGLISADQGFKGNLWADDSGIIVNSETHEITGTLIPTSDIIPDAFGPDLGSASIPFNNVYVGGSLRILNAVLTSTGTAFDLPSGTTIGGNPIGFDEDGTYGITISGNVIAQDSTVMVNTSNGSFHGDLTGSVFADDSTVLVDGRKGVLRGSLVGNADTATLSNTATVASTVSTTDTSGSTSGHYLTFTTGLSGAQTIRTDSSLQYQPSSNTLGLSILNATSINTNTLFSSTIDTSDSTGITVVPAITFNSDVTVENELTTGNIFPAVSEQSSIGTFIKKYGKLYLAEGANALWIGNVAISVSGSTLNLPVGATVGGSPITTSAGSNASTITVNTTGTSAEHFVAFFDAQSGDKIILTDDTFKYNPGTGVFSVGDATIGTVTGNLSGNVTGNLIGNSSGYHTGDMKGSIFGDDSTKLVDAVEGKFYGDLYGNLIGNVTGNVTSTGTSTFSGTLNVTGAFSGASGSFNTSTYSSAASIFGTLQSHGTADARNITFARTRGTTTAQTTIVNGDDIADIVFSGGIGGGTFVSGAQISVTVEDTAISSTSMKSRMGFSTNTGAGLVEHVTLDSNGVLTVDTFSSGSIQIVENNITGINSNEDIVINPSGTGTVDFQVVTQSTVGSAGIANSLPATPSTYFKIKVNGVEYVVPAYAVS